MSEEKFDPARSGVAAMDEETYEFVRELFQLARAGDTERLEKFLRWDSCRICATAKATAC